MTGGLTALAATLAALAGAAPAQAGIYTVYACSAAGRQWDNRSWELVSPVNNISADQDCAHRKDSIPDVPASKPRSAPPW